MRIKCFNILLSFQINLGNRRRIIVSYKALVTAYTQICHLGAWDENLIFPCFGRLTGLRGTTVLANGPTKSITCHWEETHQVEINTRTSNEISCSSSCRQKVGGGGHLVIFRV